MNDFKHKKKKKIKKIQSSQPKLGTTVNTMTSIKIDESNKITIYGIRNPITLTICGFIFVPTHFVKNYTKIVEENN